MLNAERYGRLTPDSLKFVKTVFGKILKRKSFRKWIWEQPDIGHGIDDATYGKLCHGQPVPWRFVNALQLYLAYRCGFSPTGDFAIDASAPSKEPNKLRDVNPWDAPRGMGWGLTYMLLDAFTPNDICGCQDQHDAVLAASIMIDFIGRYTVADSSFMTAEEIRKIGEREMGRTTDQLAAWFLRLLGIDEKIIMFPTVGSEKVGVSILLPLTDEASARFLKGELWDFDIRPEDIEVPSRNLLVFGVIEAPTSALIDSRRQSREVARTMSYQLSSLCKPVHRKSPRLIGIAGTPETVKRLESHGFVANGSVMPKTPRDIYTLDSKVAKKSLETYFAFSAMKVVLAFSQIYRLSKRKVLRVDE